MRTEKRPSAGLDPSEGSPHTRATRRVSMYVQTLPGLEDVLASEVRAGLGGTATTASGGYVVFALREPPRPPARLLACDRLCVLVRDSRGAFSGPRGLAEVQGKLARTEFTGALESLGLLGERAPRTFAVVAEVSGDCGFAFFDLKRVASAAIARRLGIDGSAGRADIVVHVSCRPDELRIGITVPLLSWGGGADSGGRLPRSLVGAVVTLAEPVPHAAVCDPDCGDGGLLAAWRAVAGPGRRLGLTFAGRASLTGERPPDLVRASSRNWPIAAGRLSRVISALPRVQDPGEIAKLAGETARCLAPGGRAAYACRREQDVRTAASALPDLTLERSLRVRGTDEAGAIVVLRRVGTSPSRATEVTAGDRQRATAGLGGVATRRGPAKGRSKAARPESHRPRKRRT